MCRARYYCQNLMKLEFCRQIFKKYSNIKFHKNPSSGYRVISCGRTHKHDEDDGPFSRFCESIQNDKYRKIKKKWRYVLDILHRGALYLFAFRIKKSAYEIWLGKFRYIGCLENTHTCMRTHVKLNCTCFHKNYFKWVTVNEVSYGHVLGDKSTIYIRVNLYWGYLIVLWLLYLVCILYCGCLNLLRNVWASVYEGVLTIVCFGNMCTCIYSVLYCLYCVFVLFRWCIFILTCFLYTSVSITAIELKPNFSNNNNNNNNNNNKTLVWTCAKISRNKSRRQGNHIVESTSTNWQNYPQQQTRHYNPL